MQDRHGEEARAREQKLRKGMLAVTIMTRVGCVEFYLINGGKRYVHGERIWTEDMMIRKMEVRLVVRIRLNEVRPGYNCCLYSYTRYCIALNGRKQFKPVTLKVLDQHQTPSLPSLLDT
jgi:hypothetical protein